MSQVSGNSCTLSAPHTLTGYTHKSKKRKDNVSRAKADNLWALVLTTPLNSAVTYSITFTLVHFNHLSHHTVAHKLDLLLSYS